MKFSSIEYSIPYVFIFLILFACAILEQKNIDRIISRNKLRNFAFILVLLFFGLRGYVASDWISYTHLYRDIVPINQLSLKTFKTITYEPGFLVFTSLIKTFSDNYIFYSFVNSLVDLLLLRILIKRYCQGYFIFALTIYFVFCGEIEINMLRNIKAIFLFLLSIKYISERKILPFMLINLVGLSFHNSAIFYFPLYFFIHKNNQKVYFIFTIIGLIIYFFQIHYLNTITNAMAGFLGGMFAKKNDHYITSESSGITFGVLYILIPLYWVFKNYKKIININENNLIFVNLFFLYCFSTLYFSEVLVFRARFSALFSFSLCVLFPLMYLFNRIKINRILIVNFLLVVFVSKLVLTNTPILNKYDNVIFGITSFEERTKIIEFYYRKLLD
ncbi:MULTISPECIES: EpsG family protein [Chryseobacterium]|uniref:EpsG family protein n=1 Tax=Chryseobacterium TaxID=59732 RepID=UPI0012970409|nr:MULTISPECIES: EpsG family protein [Chryseobacterium]MDR6923462.1 hypothetical protein [Chryseobacterium sp. 2987]